MRIGILGSGAMGLAIGAAAARLGHDVAFGAREEGRPLSLRGVAPARTVTYAAAAEHADLLIVALQWSRAEEVMRALAPCRKPLLSCTNPETDEIALAVGFTTSAAEEIARWSGGRVVEAFREANA